MKAGEAGVAETWAVETQATETGGRKEEAGTARLGKKQSHKGEEDGQPRQVLPSTLTRAFKAAA